jgi:hypothetical protein
MKRDKFELLVRDQNPPGDPGAIGDSCFETSCDVLANLYLAKNSDVVKKLRHFFTERGTIRHPYSPWREDDQSSDQELPLLVALKIGGDHHHALFISKFVKHRGWKTGNGQFISPGLYAEVMDSQFLRCLFLVIQVLFFWFPFYWNDGKWMKGEWPIGNSWKKSDGYLIWMLIAVQAPFPIRKLIRKKTLLAKIKAYYSVEPDSDWLISNYEQVIERYF